MPRLSEQTHLDRISQREEEVRYARNRFRLAIRAAAKAGVPKIVIAAEARISRPTLDRMLEES